MNWELVGGPPKKSLVDVCFGVLFWCACVCMQSMQMCHGVRATAHAYRSENNLGKVFTFLLVVCCCTALQAEWPTSFQHSLSLPPPCHSSTGLETCYPGQLHACIEVLYSLSPLPRLKSYFSSAHYVGHDNTL